MNAPNQLEYVLNQFSKEQRKIIYENLYAIQLTDGCSTHCDFCARESLDGVTDTIPFSVLEQIAEEITQMTDRIDSPLNQSHSYRPKVLLLYDATDPLDYEDGNYNFFDVKSLFEGKGFEIPVSTAIPSGKEKLAIQNLENIGQISISHMNRERLEPHFDDLGIGTFIDLYNYYVSKGQLEMSEENINNYSIKVVGSVEETLNKLRMKDNTLPLEARFYDLRTDGNRQRHKIQNRENLFLFCASEGDILYGKVKDRDYTTTMNIGRAFNFEPYEGPLEGVANYYGVLITPESIFNVASVKASINNKKGRIMEGVKPDEFHVIIWNPAPYIGIDPFEFKRC